MLQRSLSEEWFDRSLRLGGKNRPAVVGMLAALEPRQARIPHSDFRAGAGWFVWVRAGA